MAHPADSSPDLTYPPGYVIAGKYRVERVLGRGGMGLVLAAHDLQLERPVAIKVMLPGREHDSDGIQRFLREGRAAVKLTSDHVAKVFEVGVDGDAPFLVMEYLDGSDLGAVLARQGKLGLAESADYVLQACEAIAEAHAAGVVHRDLKPQNLFLARRPNGRFVVKVLDFGISKVMRTDPAQLTRSGAVLGTPLYMAPEQMRSARQADPRTDVWALGVVLYELVTGRPPFLGETIPELALRIAEEEPVGMRALLPDVPEGFERVVLRCMRKDPAKRYPTVDALVADLLPFGSARAPGSPHTTGPNAKPSHASTPLGVAETLLAAPAASDGAARGRAVRTGVSWGTTANATADRKRDRRRAIVVRLVAVAAVGGSIAAGYAVLHARTDRVAPSASAAAMAPPPSVELAPEPLPTRIDNANTPATSTAPMPTASSPPAPPSPPPATAHAVPAHPASSAHPPPHHVARPTDVSAAPAATVDPGSVR
jgi:hypothetical protein